MKTTAAFALLSAAGIVNAFSLRSLVSSPAEEAIPQVAAPLEKRARKDGNGLTCKTVYGAKKGAIKYATSTASTTKTVTSTSTLIPTITVLPPAVVSHVVTITNKHVHTVTVQSNNTIQVVTNVATVTRTIQCGYKDSLNRYASPIDKLVKRDAEADAEAEDEMMAIYGRDADTTTAESTTAAATTAAPAAATTTSAAASSTLSTRHRKHHHHHHESHSHKSHSHKSHHHDQTSTSPAATSSATPAAAPAAAFDIRAARQYPQTVKCTSTHTKIRTEMHVVTGRAIKYRPTTTTTVTSTKYPNVVHVPGSRAVHTRSATLTEQFCAEPSS